MKILAPAGNFECLKSAVYNGADEVYLGINQFNARNNVDGFTLESLSSAVDFAHLFNVKVLLAINILFLDSELNSAVNTAVKAYNMGVDALIVQDLGLIKLLSENYPEIELHASTQMGVHNLEGVKQLEKYNIKRVVLARETPLEEIKRIKQNSNIELEYFCQGALCVSFSGNCYLSSYLFNQSGNRGKCKQLCRLPFTLEKDGKKIKRGYLLSAKDFNMSNRLNDLENAGIDVIKIEGRARRAFYVATATKEYYNLIHKKPFFMDNIKLAFNRTYTAGYLDGNGDIISNIQNHIGIKVGKVTKINFGKKFNQVYFSSNREISKKSVLKFLGDNETTISAFDLTEITLGNYMLTTTQKVGPQDAVHLIVDEELERQSLEFFVKKPISVSISAFPNDKIYAKVQVDKLEFEVYGATCLPAVNNPLDEKEIASNFSKSQLFSANLSVKTNGAFLPKKDLNDFRRKVFSSAYDNLVSAYKRNLKPFEKNISGKIDRFSSFYFTDSLNFNTLEKNVVYSPETYDIKNVQEFINICNKKGKTPFLDTPNFALEKDVLWLRDIISKTNVAIIANNYYALGLPTQIIIGGFLNVFNSVTSNALNLPAIVAESQEESLRYKMPYMTLRHCPIKTHFNCDCNSCAYKDGISYKMDNGKTFKLKRKKLSSCTFYLTD